jgi:predicted DNA-binding antitoxin AbrB/MazE fold protein
MTAPIRAIYEDGKLRPLVPLDLTEGQEVKIVISSAEDPVLAALGDLVIMHSPVDLPEIDEEALQREIDEACQDIPPVSEAIIEERRTGP